MVSTQYLSTPAVWRVLGTSVSGEYSVLLESSEYSVVLQSGVAAAMYSVNEGQAGIPVPLTVSLHHHRITGNR